MLVTPPVDYYDHLFDKEYDDYKLNDIKELIKNKKFKLTSCTADDIISLGFELVSEDKTTKYFEKSLLNNKNVPNFIVIEFLSLIDGINLVRIRKNDAYILYDYEFTTKQELFKVLKGLRCL